MITIDHMFVMIERAPDHNIVSIERTDGEGNSRAHYSIVDYPNTIDAAEVERIREKLITPFGEKYVIICTNLELSRSWYVGIIERFRPSDKPFPEPTAQSIFLGRTWIDVLQLAWPLQLSGAIQGRNLEVLATYYQAQGESPLSTLENVYWATMKRYKLLVGAEKMARDFAQELGGGLIDNVFSLFGK